MSDIIYQLDYSEVYLEDLQRHKKSGQKKVLIKIKSLIDEIEVHPTKGKGKPEQLKGYGERSVYIGGSSKIQVNSWLTLP